MSFLDFKILKDIFFSQNEFLGLLHPKDIFGLPRMRGVRYGRSRLPTVFARLTSPLPPLPSNRKENLIILRNLIPSPVSR